jgi:hypothetical protein
MRCLPILLVAILGGGICLAATAGKPSGDDLSIASAAGPNAVIIASPDAGLGKGTFHFPIIDPATARHVAGLVEKMYASGTGCGTVWSGSTRRTHCTCFSTAAISYTPTKCWRSIRRCGNGRNVRGPIFRTLPRRMQQVNFSAITC